MIYSCDCSVECDETSEHDHDDMRKARKQHTCVECKRTIEPGETYEVSTILRDGSWFSFKTCRGCVLIRKHLSPNGWIFGGLAEHVAECIGFNYVTGEPLDGFEEQMQLLRESEENRTKEENHGPKPNAE